MAVSTQGDVVWEMLYALRKKRYLLKSALETRAFIVLKVMLGTIYIIRSP